MLHCEAGTTIRSVSGLSARTKALPNRVTSESPAIREQRASAKVEPPPRISSNGSHLSLRPKPFKCFSNGFVHRDFGAISRFTSGLGAVQVLTRRHHRNGTGRYFRNRAVQMLIRKNMPCRKQPGCGQRNLLGFGNSGMGGNALE
jgi:hypothetical protein